MVDSETPTSQQTKENELSPAAPPTSTATIGDTAVPANDKKIPYNLFSITPKRGSIMGTFVLSVRGRNFVERDLKVHFVGSDNRTVASTKVRFISRSLLEVVVPNLSIFRSDQPKKMMVRVRVACAGRGYTKETRFLKLLEKCTIVRKCLKVRGHDGKCCSDEGPPIYATQSRIRLSGGHFSTAMIGYRTKKKKKNFNGESGPATTTTIQPLPLRRPTPGGKIGTALLGYRTKNGYKPNSLPGPVNPPSLPPPGGGHFSTALMGYRTKGRNKKKDGGVPVRPPPEHKVIPGGRFGTALMGYRTRDRNTRNSLPGPVNPPNFPKSGGGHFSTAMIGHRTKPIVKKDSVPMAEVPMRPQTPGGRFGNAMMGYRTKRQHAQTPGNTTDLAQFGTDTPGGAFNTHGAKNRNEPIQKDHNQHRCIT